ncbi:MAG: invasion associated locus B family protein [Mesorhizobium sp.]|nr:MAG: invasion associated locus B family protein [Mesorhizobium sp.]
MNSWLWRLGLSRLGLSRLGLSRSLAKVILLAAVSTFGLSGVGLSGIGQANAQPSGKVRSTHGAWSIICDTPAGATSEQCVMMQNVVAEDRPEMGLSVVVLRTADNKAEILRVLAPLGVLLPNGLGLNVDGKDIGRAYFVRCFQDGCYAEVILEKPLLDTLKTGTSATFIVFQTPEEGIGIPVELKGFADGFAALP